MGRKKIIIQEIEDERIRRVTFKKRRIGLLKKAIQLSKLTGALVELKVYNWRDQSLIEYFSHTEDDFSGISKKCQEVTEYGKFFNRHYDLVSEIDERVTKHGNTCCSGNGDQDDDFH